MPAQYNHYELASGRPFNGELTIGENIADTSGLAIAHDAYQMALGHQPAPVLDGITGEQRFHLGFDRIRASEPITAQTAINQALADTHALDSYASCPLRLRGRGEHRLGKQIDGLLAEIGIVEQHQGGLPVEPVSQQ